MNVMFFQRNYKVGGVNIVSQTLANKFVEEGHSVSIFIFSDAIKGTEDSIDHKIHQYVGVSYNKYKKENLLLLRDAFEKEQPDIIINNWGLHWMMIYTARKAMAQMKKKPFIISVYHNSPDANGRIQDIDIKFANCHSTLTKVALLIEKWVVKKITALSMRYVYSQSDAYQLLSPTFVETFKNFTGIASPKKIIVQTNPLTLSTENFKLDPMKKNKEIIYVGRLDPNQKKVCRIIDTWSLIEKEYPDWSLIIVGDGPERKTLEEKIVSYQLQNVSLEGTKMSKPYYENSSIMFMASEYEGFPLVLAEAMAFGCIPVVYESYTSARDIIDDGIDGLLIPYNQKGFEAKKAAAIIKNLLDNNNLRNSMMQNAVEKSKVFSMDTIYKQWEEILTKCKK